MLKRPRAPSLAGWAVTLAAVAIAAALTWATAASPSLPFLIAPPGPASWIVYSRPGDTKTKLRVELPARFTRSFYLASVPATAPMRLRAFRRGSVRINGHAVELAPALTWKAERRTDVARLLRSGPNQLEVEISNDLGPPALWLSVDLPGSQLVTDTRWEVSWAGATPGLAALATDPMRGTRSDPLGLAPTPARALTLEWKLLVGFAVLSLGLIGAGLLARHRGRGMSLWAEGSPWPLRIAFASIALLWEALFLNNARSLPLGVGFDADHHAQYVRYLLERRALPLADEGWQMFQPPLYYVLTALGVAATGTQVDGPGAAWIVRLLGLASGLAHLAVVAAGLRLLFPRDTRSQVLGLTVAGFLPCMLSMHQFIGNEPLMAAFAGGALLVTLHSLKGPPRLSRELVLGALLGLAILSKISALLLLPPVFGALLFCALRDSAGRRRRLLGLMAVSGTLLAVCGWYFVRVWQKFGTPFVGGWDVRRGIAWWQDPGYRTFADFLRFGHVFSEPVYAGYNGFWDGLYSTLWGDGLLSGQVALSVPYHWSISLMSAGIALAIVPCIATLVGAAETLVSWVCRPTAAAGILLALAALVLTASALMSIQVPSPSSEKASYGILALLALGAFAARGLERFLRPSRWGGIAIATVLGTWAITAYATQWIHGGWFGNEATGADDLAGGAVSLGEHTYADLLPSRLVELNGPDGTLIEARRALAMCLDPLDCARLATALEARGQISDAEHAWREVLRFEPQAEQAHRTLATLYGRMGDREAAARHLDWSERVARAARTRGSSNAASSHSLSPSSSPPE